MLIDTQLKTPQKQPNFHLQITDPGGHVRRMRLHQFPMQLGYQLSDLRQLRDAKLDANCLQLTYENERLHIEVLQADVTVCIGDLKLRSFMVPDRVPIRVGNTELIFSESEFKAESMQFPTGEQAWFTESASGLDLLRATKRAASTKLSIYFFGETGTGKEVLAKLTHLWSERSSRAFIPINCGALPLSLVESELFGHVKGSFTGAVRDRPGAFLQAHGGTLFLDEVGDLPLEVQVKLLRFLECGEIRPVGSDRVLKSDVRLICATHKPLLQMVKEGKFRQDLYFRLASIPIEIPNLRSRPDDIESLARIFCKEFGRDISEHAIHRLKSYPWPGNVRELRHAIERASGTMPQGEMILSESDFNFLIHQDIQSLGSESSEKENVLPGIYKLSEMERVLIIRALKITKGNRAEAAQVLGVARSTLFEMLKRHKIVGPKSSTYWAQELSMR
jgi:transcriptional regulator with PAS, ATPase and Fis domain